jgi:hypothetical protein
LKVIGGFEPWGLLECCCEAPPFRPEDSRLVADIPDAVVFARCEQKSPGFGRKPGPVRKCVATDQIRKCSGKAVSISETDADQIHGGAVATPGRTQTREELL